MKNFTADMVRRSYGDFGGKLNDFDSEPHQTGRQQMRNSASSDFDIWTRPALTFGELTDTDVRKMLLPFYVGMDFDTRRARFGGALSDQAVEHYCSKLNLGTSVVLGCWAAARLLAAMELHPLRNDWTAAELSIADRADTDRTTIMGHLLQLAAFAAGKRGCSTLFVQCSDRETKDLLKGMGRIMTHSDSIFVDIGDYASIIHQQGMITASVSVE